MPGIQEKHSDASTRADFNAWAVYKGSAKRTATSLGADLLRIPPGSAGNKRCAAQKPHYRQACALTALELGSAPCANECDVKRCRGGLRSVRNGRRCALDDRWTGRRTHRNGASGGGRPTLRRAHGPMMTAQRNHQRCTEAQGQNPFHETIPRRWNACQQQPSRESGRRSGREGQREGQTICRTSPQGKPSRLEKTVLMRAGGRRQQQSTARPSMVQIRLPAIAGPIGARFSTHCVQDSLPTPATQQQRPSIDAEG